MKRPRRNHSAVFKAKVADGGARRQDPGGIGAQQFEVHPNQIIQWKTQLQERARDVFVTAAERRRERSEREGLHAKIGQLSMENDFLSVALGRIGDPSAKR